jgi:hypothetical protein
MTANSLPDLICMCGHGLSRHSENGEICNVAYTTAEDGDHDGEDQDEDGCYCTGFRPLITEATEELWFLHPVPCKHSFSCRPDGRGGLKGVVCMLCDKEWTCLLHRDPPSDVLQEAKDAFIEGRDDDAWAILEQAFAPPTEEEIRLLERQRIELERFMRMKGLIDNLGFQPQPFSLPAFETQGLNTPDPFAPTKPEKPE